MSSGDHIFKLTLVEWEAAIAFIFSFFFFAYFPEFWESERKNPISLFFFIRSVITFEVQCGWTSSLRSGFWSVISFILYNVLHVSESFFFFRLYRLRLQNKTFFLIRW